MSIFEYFEKEKEAFYKEESKNGYLYDKINFEQYATKPNEQPWDHTSRIIVNYAFPILAQHDTSRFHKKSEPIVYAYIFNESQHIRALRLLLESQVKLWNLCWTTTPSENSIPKVIGMDEMLGWNDINSVFAEYVKSWQPLMDAIASIIQFAMETSRIFNFKKNVSMYTLSKAAEDTSWPQKTEIIRWALTEKADFYVNMIRLLRNDLVHNKLIATLTPIATTKSTVVELKSLQDDRLERFNLDDFIEGLYRKYLLFSVCVVEGIKTLY